VLAVEYEDIEGARSLVRGGLDVRSGEAVAEVDIGYGYESAEWGILRSGCSGSNGRFQLHAAMNHWAGMVQVKTSDGIRCP